MIVFTNLGKKNCKFSYVSIFLCYFLLCYDLYLINLNYSRYKIFSLFYNKWRYQNCVGIVEDGNASIKSTIRELEIQSM